MKLLSGGVNNERRSKRRKVGLTKTRCDESWRRRKRPSGSKNNTLGTENERDLYENVVGRLERKRKKIL